MKNDNPECLVSICCLAYNHESYIRKALEGFVTQRVNFSFEIIVHDDCSTDNTVQIIGEYEANYPNLFRVIRQSQNQYSQGIKPIFKYVFPAARGKYIALCEGDDYWTDPYKLQKQVDFLEANEEFTGAYTDTMELKDGRMILWRKNLKTAMTLNDVIDIYSPFHTSSFLYRKDTLNIKDFERFMNVPSADMVLFTLVASKGKLVKIEAEPTVYRKHDGGITNSSVNKSISLHFNRIMLWEKMKEVVSMEHEKMNSVMIKHLLMVMNIAKIPLAQIIHEIGHEDVIKLIGRRVLLKKILFKK